MATAEIKIQLEAAEFDLLARALATLSFSCERDLAWDKQVGFLTPSGRIHLTRIAGKANNLARKLRRDRLPVTIESTAEIISEV